MQKDMRTATLSARTPSGLVEIGRGPLSGAQYQPGFEEELNYALAAIDELARRAPTDPESTAALVDVIQKTCWGPTTDHALDLILPLASPDQLIALAYFVYDYFHTGETGGGTVMPWRLKRVSDRLAELGMSLMDLFATEKRGDINALLRLGMKEERRRTHTVSSNSRASHTS